MYFYVKLGIFFSKVNVSLCADMAVDRVMTVSKVNVSLSLAYFFRVI